MDFIISERLIRELNNKKYKIEKTETTNINMKTSKGKPYFNILCNTNINNINNNCIKCGQYKLFCICDTY